jgi:splicing factor 45
MGDDDDVNNFYGSEKRQRGGRKKRNKKKDVVRAQDWNDIYDPSRPNTYEEYKHSEERYRMISDWKARIHAHSASAKRRSSMDSNLYSDDEPQRIKRNSMS